jgi:hypothetical protein
VKGEYAVLFNADGLQLPVCALNPGERLLRSRKQYSGLVTPYAYIPIGGAVTGMHCEDFGLLSPNLLDARAAKLWVIVHPSSTRDFEHVVWTELSIIPKCSQFV